VDFVLEDFHGYFTWLLYVQTRSVLHNTDDTYSACCKILQFITINTCL